MRRDAHRSPLQCPYEGPFKVITAGEKSFTIDRGGKIENISVNRLKPAHVDLDALLNYMFLEEEAGQGNTPSRLLSLREKVLPYKQKNKEETILMSSALSDLGGAM